MQDNLVSIITPAYKTEKFIAETIDSVQAQTYPDWELLITDDCSPDNLADVVKSFAEKDDRIKYLRAPQNGGPANARNISLEKARGRFIAFLDSDDLWHPEKLERQLHFMKNKGYAFTYTAYQRMKMNGEMYPFVNYIPEKMTYKDLLKNTCISTLTVILDRTLLPSFKMTPGWGYDDFTLWLDLLARGVTARGLNENLAFYRVMETSVSSNKKRAIIWVWKIYRHKLKLTFFESVFCISCFILNATKKRIYGK